MLRSLTTAATICAALAAAGCGSSKPKPAAATPPPVATQTAPQTTTPARALTAAPGCKAVALPQPGSEGHLSAPRKRLDASKRYTATLRTNCGTITIALDVKHAPRTVASFVALARRGFYDKLTFHRIVPGFVIQGGDPTGSGQGGPGYSITEKPPASARYKRGVVAMAKTQDEPAGTSGSQFFIVTGADAQLPPDYAIVGRVTAGEKAVTTIGAAPTDAQQFPTSPIVISRMTIKTS